MFKVVLLFGLVSGLLAYTLENEHLRNRRAADDTEDIDWSKVEENTLKRIKKEIPKWVEGKFDERNPEKEMIREKNAEAAEKLKLLLVDPGELLTIKENLNVKQVKKALMDGLFLFTYRPEDLPKDEKELVIKFLMDKAKGDDKKVLDEIIKVLKKVNSPSKSLNITMESNKLDAQILIADALCKMLEMDGLLADVEEETKTKHDAIKTKLEKLLKMAQKNVADTYKKQKKQ